MIFFVLIGVYIVGRIALHFLWSSKAKKEVAETNSVLRMEDAVDNAMLDISSKLDKEFLLGKESSPLVSPELSKAATKAVRSLVAKKKQNKNKRRRKNRKASKKNKI